MKLGLLGTAPELEGVVSLARQRGDTIVRVPDPTPAAGTRPWEALLDEQSCAAVLVGATGWCEERAEAVRGLVQAGRTLLVAHPLGLSMLWAFEIDMIRRDSAARLVPFLPDRLHPAIATLHRDIEAGLAGAAPLGAVESVSLERTLPERTRETVLAALARDADLVRVLVGDPARLATLGAASPDDAWPTLAVGFSGPGLVPVRWQVLPGAASRLAIVVQHAGGAVRLVAPADGTPWTLDDAPVAAFDRDQVMLDLLDRTIRGAPAVAGTGPAPAGWPDAARAIELADTVPRSLAKGRAVDLHREEFSELGTFRGTMASLGCGLVLLALVVVVLATLVAGIANEFDWEFGRALTATWPVVILGVLGLFLLLQLLPWLVGAGPPTDRDPPPPEPPTR